MEQYGDEVIDAIAERLRQFEGRMLFFGERQEVAREMVSKNLLDASSLIETINRFSGDNKKPGWSGYVNFCVNCLSQTDDPAEKLLAIALDTKMFWHVRREAFKCIGDLPSKESLNQEQWEQVATQSNQKQRIRNVIELNRCGRSLIVALRASTRHCFQCWKVIRKNWPTHLGRSCMSISTNGQTLLFD